MLSRYLIILALMILAGSATIFSQQPRQESKPVLYVIGTSHLDSQWNWTVQDTIREFVPNTFFENFKRFEKYPDTDSTMKAQSITCGSRSITPKPGPRYRSTLPMG